ncbi:hypothetical protein GCM10011579_054460 [Streptomyces albiflavescens]|uniref:Uncharacterized protein n=1 Tax=Streptomyces albiflavescens TaxID=1623582 RepID=A0A917Y868_9ACTN|nr:hypothetical protein GCM10011579_054460 [Streptomyces albiflavescens]
MPVLSAASAEYRPSATAAATGSNAPRVPPVPAIQMLSKRIGRFLPGWGGGIRSAAAVGQGVPGLRGKRVERYEGPARIARPRYHQKRYAGIEAGTTAPR